MAFPAIPATVSVQMAFGADVTAAPATWTWTDVTEYWEVAEPITAQDGRSEGAIQAESLQATLTLDATDGTMVPDHPESPYWPYLEEGTPVWVTVDAGAGAYSLIRGYISALALVWPGRSGHLCWTRVTVRGILDRLGRGTTPLRLPLERAILRDQPIQYWQLLDGADAPTQASPAIAGGTPLAVSGSPQWAQVDGLPGMPGKYPILKDSTGTLGTLSASVIMSADGYFAVESWIWLDVDKSPTYDAVAYLLSWTCTGAQPCWYAEYQWNASASEEWLLIQHKAFPGDGTSSGAIVALPNGSFAGGWRHLRAVGYTSGANLVTELYLDGTLRASGSTTGAAGRIISITTSPAVYFGGTPFGDQRLARLIQGHIAIFGAPALEHHSPGHGWEGEAASTRILRLCAEEGVPATVYSGTSEPMGVQTSAKILDLLRECEAADEGRLGELGWSLVYRPRSALYNQAPALTLDGAAAEVAEPYAPRRDLSRRRNEWQASRSGGGSRTYVDLVDQQRLGRLDDSATINVLADDALLHHAEWRVGMGTLRGLRYPSLSVDLGRHTNLLTTWQALQLGQRIQATPPTRQHPPGTVDQIMEGRSQTLTGRTSWTVSMVTSPARPYDVWVVEGALNLGRVESASTYLGVAAATTDTVLSAVTSAGPVLTTTASCPTDLPVDLDLAGERVTCSAIYGNGTTSWRAAGTAVHADNAAITPGMPAGWQPGDLLLLLAAIRNSPDGYPVTPAGYTILGSAGNLRLFGRTARAGDTAPTVTFAGGVSGASTSARLVAIPGASTRVLATSQVLNASAQDVITPAITAPYASTILMAAWKADDATGITAPAGLTLGYQTWTTLGDDQAITLAYKITAAGETIPTGSFAVTGGTPAISRALAVVLLHNTQTLMVTRSVNGVTKAPPIGTGIRLWQPGQIAL